MITSGCFVRILTIKGKEKRSGEGFNVAKDTVVADNILKLVDDAWERLTVALSMQPELTETSRFKQNLLYPQRACREGLINAIVHRNYAIEGRGIEVSIYQDRMEILSPGMLLSTISIDDLRKLKGVHESRNPLIARVLREVGLVRELGEGIRAIYDVMRSSALAEPDIESATTGFALTLYHKSLYDPNVKLWLSNFDRYKLTESQVAVLALGYGGKEFSTQDIIDRLGIVNIDQVREILTPLRNWGLIERTKNDLQAIRFSERMHIPKREVPRFRVVESSSGRIITTQTSPQSATSRSGAAEISKPATPAAGLLADNEKLESDLEAGHELELFIGGIDYLVTKQELVQFLQAHCSVAGVYMPPGGEYGSQNKGYAFVTAIGDDVNALLKVLDGKMLKGRRLNVRSNRSERKARRG